MKLAIAIGACALSCFAITPALAFHPFDDTYGYVSPKEQRAKRKTASSQLGGGSGWEWDKPARKSDADDDDKPVTKKKSAGNAKSQLTGGARPRIAASAPPTVHFPNGYGEGTVVIDTAGRRLYYVLSSSRAYAYPIAVGRQGFTWTGTQKISKAVPWPDWRPPAEMRARQPYLPEHMEGGVRNPLGAMALYLGNTLYRIHGTNDVKSIGTAASSGCIRMTNGHVMHLAGIAGVGTTVHVLRRLPSNIANAARVAADG